MLVLLSISSMRFSALQRAEIAEIGASVMSSVAAATCFSALQRAEIAEINMVRGFVWFTFVHVSVLFNEPKLLKSFHYQIGNNSNI